MYENDASPFGFAGAKVSIFCGTAKLLSIFLQKTLTGDKRRSKKDSQGTRFRASGVVEKGSLDDEPEGLDVI